MFWDFKTGVEKKFVLKIQSCSADVFFSNPRYTHATAMPNAKVLLYFKVFKHYIYGKSAQTMSPFVELLSARVDIYSSSHTSDIWTHLLKMY